MEKYYGQQGEDFLTDKIFQGNATGFYVEIGCLDGIEFSNTYLFEKKGWKGICIEAHKDFVELLKMNRPSSQIVHCAVGEKDQESVTFYANKIGSLSTLDKTQEERWKKNYKEFFYGFEEQIVAMKTLTTIFAELNVDQIDFISLDIEGYEVQALSGLDLSRYKPRIFIIEYKDDLHKAEVEAILIPHGYHYLAIIGCNLFYGTDASDGATLQKNYGSVPLVILDKDGNQIIRETLVNNAPLDLMTRISRKIKVKIKALLAGKTSREEFFAKLFFFI